jgi:hypothetical protein
MTSPRSSRRGLWVASGAVLVLGLVLWLLQPWASLPPLSPPPSLPFQVVFHGPRDARIEAELVAALELARKHWKDFTGTELELNPHRPLHFVTQFEAMPRHGGQELHPTWEKFEACEGAVHFAPAHFTSDRPTRRVDYDELRDLLEKELLRKALIVLRGHEPRMWMLDGALWALQDKRPPPRQQRVDWLERQLAYGWKNRGKDMKSRLSWLCPSASAGPPGMCSTDRPSPWIQPLLHYIRETRGPQGVLEALRTTENPVDLVSVLDPELSEKGLRAFDDNFEVYLRRNWSELIAPPPDGTSPSTP